jgi:uncharacterized membrane protein
MHEPVSVETTALAPTADAVPRLGYILFALAIIALGIETFACAGRLEGTLIESDSFGHFIGPLLVAGGVGLLFKRTMRPAAMALGALLFLYALIFEVPHYARDFRSISSRTAVFEPLSIAALAWRLPGPHATPSWLARASRYLLGVSLIIFGVDHFLALAPIGTLIPPWLPWHVFWIAFFGAAFIAGGMSIGLNIQLRWGAISIGLMFAIWVFTLHLPRTLFGLYGGSGPRASDEWSSLFIAIALWGGSWALARSQQNTRAS